MLADDGCVYCAPAEARRVLKIDPVANTVTLIGNDFGSRLGSWKWRQGALANDGCIYYPPLTGFKVLNQGRPQDR